MKTVIENLETECIGKKLTGIYFPILPEAEFSEEYRKTHINGAYSDFFLFECEDKLFWVNKAFLFQDDEEFLIGEEKKNMFCGNELYSDYIGRKINSITYSFDLVSYTNAYVPYHRIEIDLENEAKIVLKDLKFYERKDGMCIVELDLWLSAKYRNSLLKMALDEDLSPDALLELTNPMASMKESETEEYARKILVERGIIAEND